MMPMTDILLPQTALVVTVGPAAVVALLALVAAGIALVRGVAIEATTAIAS